jgi:drug/metabolite transporter (DMT)-like permease
VAALAGAVVVWGTTFVVSDAALASMSPAVLTVARFVLALVVLVPLAVRRGGLAAATWSAPVALLGATGVAAYYGLQNLGLVSTTAGTAAVLQAVLPVATALIALVWLRERLSLVLLAGLALATVGVALIAGGLAADASAGAGLIALGVLAYALYTVLLRREPDRDPVILAAATCGWGVAFLLPWLAGEALAGAARLDLDAGAVASLVYLGLAASALTLLLWTYGAARVPASTAGVFTASIPAVGYLCAVVAGEPSSWANTVGSALALLGAIVAASAGLQTSRETTRHRHSATTK